MKRFRLSTLLLFVVIAALVVALVEQGRRAAHREAVLESRLAEANGIVAEHYKLGIIRVDDDATVRKLGK